MMFERLVQAWNGKWHVWEADLGMSPAEPVGPHNSVAKPERVDALTSCGEQIYVRKRLYEYPVRLYPQTKWRSRAGWKMDQSLTWCSRCATVVDHRLTDKLEELNNGC